MASNVSKDTLTAMETALNTTELLEQILSCLPMPQSLGKSRVCHKWKSVIDGSASLQTALFLRPREGQTEVVSPSCWHPKSDYYIHLSRLSSSMLGIKDMITMEMVVDAPLYHVPIELNPLMHHDNQANLHVTHEVTLFKQKSSIPIASRLHTALGKYNRAYVRHRFGTEPLTAQANSSWRSMYLTMPPITDIVLRIPTNVGSYPNPQFLRIVVHAASGITLGLVRDRVEEVLRKVKIRDGRPVIEKRRNGPLSEKDFASNWGKRDHVMFSFQEVDEGSKE
jgi:hypothetical protein